MHDVRPLLYKMKAVGCTLTVEVVLKAEEDEKKGEIVRKMLVAGILLRARSLKPSYIFSEPLRKVHP